MANPVTFASSLQFTGIAKETQQGTAVPMTATIPTDKFDNEDKVTMLEDTANRGSMGDVYDNLLGVAHSECTISGPVFADTLPWLLAGILGDIAAAGSAPVVHTIGLLNAGAANAQPTSYTFTDYTGIGTNKGRAWPGQMFESVTIKWTAAGLCTYEAKTKGWPSSLLGAVPTPAASAVSTVPSWKAAPTIAGSAVTNMEDGEFTITRALDLIDTADGSQSPYFIRGGKVGMTFKFTQVAADEVPLTNMLTNVIPTLGFTLDNGIAGAGMEKFVLQMSKAAYRVSKRDISKESVRFMVEGKAIHNTTDVGASGGFGPCKFTVSNQVTAGTYA